MLIAGTCSELEEEPEYESEIGQPTQYKATGGRVSSAKYKPPLQSSYSKPRYPQPPPSYPAEQSPYKHSYEQDEYNYCNPRTPPKCVKNTNDIFCMKDFEYPEKEVQVIFSIIYYFVIIIQHNFSVVLWC